MCPNQLNNSTLETAGQLEARVFICQQLPPRPAGSWGVYVWRESSVPSVLLSRWASPYRLSQNNLSFNYLKIDGGWEVGMGQTFLQIHCPRRLKKKLQVLYALYMIRGGLEEGEKVPLKYE